jgi:formamidopyrimidine-DNA glycosylase
MKEIRMTKNIGLDALSQELTFARFWELIWRRRRQIKVVLMDQSIIAGIGNIYASEILWKAKVHPKTKAFSLEKDQGMNIYKAMRSILVRAIQKRGTTAGEFRDTANKPGQYGSVLKVYHRQEQPCFRCQTSIKRTIINGRGTFYCPKCQKPL